MMTMIMTMTTTMKMKMKTKTKISGWLEASSELLISSNIIEYGRYFRELQTMYDQHILKILPHQIFKTISKMLSKMLSHGQTILSKYILKYILIKHLLKGEIYLILQ